jgi:hypothetical protein
MLYFPQRDKRETAIYIYIYIYVEREGKRGREREREREIDKVRECMCERVHPHMGRRPYSCWSRRLALSSERMGESGFGSCKIMCTGLRLLLAGEKHCAENCGWGLPT